MKKLMFFALFLVFANLNAQELNYNKLFKQADTMFSLQSCLSLAIDGELADFCHDEIKAAQKVEISNTEIFMEFEKIVESKKWDFLFKNLSDSSLVSQRKYLGKKLDLLELAASRVCLTAFNRARLAQKSNTITAKPDVAAIDLLEAAAESLVNAQVFYKSQSAEDQKDLLPLIESAIKEVSNCHQMLL